MDLRDNYEFVRFSTRVTNTSVTRGGFRIGDFLIVSFSDERRNAWKIFRSQDGMECLGTTFKTANDAIRCAEWLLDTYGEFMFIWTEYPNAELFRWTYLTIENGEKYMKILEDIEDQKEIIWDDVLQHIN